MKKYPKKRSHAVHANATLETVAWLVAEEYGLPEESLKFTNPNGRKARKDKKVGDLRKNWQ